MDKFALISMEPSRDTHAGLVDLLDRILDKGLILDTDLIISVAGIPLLGVNLKAMLASIETMLKYGKMKDWDEAQRAYASLEWEKRQRQSVPLVKGEEVFVKMFGSYCYRKGILRSWQTGHFYVTDRRIFLYRKEPPEVLFEAYYEDTKGMVIERDKNVARKETDYLYLLLKTGEVAKLHPGNASAIKDAVETKMKAKGLKLDEKPPIPAIDERAHKFLTEGEEVTHSGKMWHLLSTTGGVASGTWKTGHLYLTNRRLCWWYSFDGCIAFETPIDRLMHAAIELFAESCGKDLGGMLKKKGILAVLYKNGEDNKIACFSGDEKEMEQWQEAIRIAIARQEVSSYGEATETCPQCNSRAPVNKLIKEGCKVCGWVGPKIKERR